MTERATLSTCAPQLLVADLQRAVAYYVDRLGFEQHIGYGGFYAGVRRGAAEIHLKCAPELPGHTRHRRDNEHLDAFIEVTAAELLYRELRERGATILRGLEHQSWGTIDFCVADPDGHILCFSASDPASVRAEVAARIRATARLTGSFTLRSGAVSDTYFDKYQFESDPELLRAIVRLAAPLLPPGTQVLAGLEMGGIPVVTALSQVTGLPAAFIRKTAKTHGTARYAEGPALAGRGVVLIEDVVSSGGEILNALRKLRADGVAPLGAVCIIDRESGAAAALRAAELPFSAVFTLRDIEV